MWLFRCNAFVTIAANYNNREHKQTMMRKMQSNSINYLQRKEKAAKIIVFSNIKNVYCYSYTTFHTSNYELFTFINIIFGICMKRQYIN